MKVDNIDAFIEDVKKKDFEMIQNIYKRDMLLIEKRIKDHKNSELWEEFLKTVNNEHNEDLAPIKMMIKFIENNGDQLIYLKTISILYPEHPFCHMLIKCKSISEFLDKIKLLKIDIPFFQDNGKQWLSELFELTQIEVS